jgi:putative PIG3 family NAD(P)H quinone oxidoreductase
MTDVIPETMTVIDVSKPGGPDVIVPAKRPVPRPGFGEYLIKVASAGVNGADLSQREGRYPMPPGAPDIMGLEIAGTVVAAGPGTTRWKVGDRLCALVIGGGYAEYCLAPEVQCLPIPAGLDLVQAAALPEVVMTVWANVFEHGALKAGETLLVHGGASGIGTTAIQLARLLGARVLATAGNPDKCAACVRLGAARAIDYRAEDFVAAAKQATGGAGVDVILDMVGADYFGRNLELLKPNGRLVMIAFLGGYKTEIDLRTIQSRHAVVTGSRLRGRSLWDKQRIRDIVERVAWPFYADGRMVPVIDSTFPLVEARQAHERMHSGKHIGKVMLLP